MALTISSTVRSTSTQWTVAVVLSSYDVVADPAAYISGSTTVQAEILAAAGLDADCVFISVTLTSSSTVGSQHRYTLAVVFGDVLTAGGHTHGCDTVTFPLQCAYADGPIVVLDPTTGPIILSRPTTADMTYLQLRYGTTDLFKVSNTAIRVGNHIEFYPDNTYDLGTPDEGTTLRRPRDVRVGRHLFVLQNVMSGGYAVFANYVRAKYDVLAPQAVNPTIDASVRHIYVNSVDNTLRYWDGTLEHILGTTSGSDTLGLWNCGAGVQIRDAVYCNAADSVDRANASTLAGKEIVGICVSKPTAITAVVRYSGEIPGYGGLAAGALYYVSTSSGLITNDVSGFVTGDTVLQVGIAKNGTTLVYQPGDPTIL
jgi:hypothetical protein